MYAANYHRRVATMNYGHFAIKRPQRNGSLGSELNPVESQKHLPPADAAAVIGVAFNVAPDGPYGPRPESYGGGSVRQFDPYEDEWGNQLEED
jgi:hypothetical protein